MANGKKRSYLKMYLGCLDGLLLSVKFTYYFCSEETRKKAKVIDDDHDDTRNNLFFPKASYKIHAFITILVCSMLVACQA